MTDADFAESIRQQIWDNQTFSDYKHYGDFYHNSSHQGTSHLSVIAENGDAVSATTTINLLWVSDVVGFRKFSWGSGVGKDRDMHVLVAWPLILICPINEARYGGDSILLGFAPPPSFLSWEFPLELRWKISLQKELSSRKISVVMVTIFKYLFSVFVSLLLSFFLHSFIYLFFSFNSKLTALDRDIVQLVQASSITTKWTTFLLLVRRTHTVLNRPSLTWLCLGNGPSPPPRLRYF